MKMLRLLIISLVYVILWTLLFATIPSITWLFGGSFTEVVSSPSYIIFSLICYNLLLGCLFDKTVDGEDYTFKD